MQTSSPIRADAAPNPHWAACAALAFVALWPWPGIADGVLSLSAVVTLVWLAVRRFRGSDALLSREAWALTTALFFSYWLPELLSGFDAIDPLRSLREIAVDLRYLPFLWLAAIAVHRSDDRRIVFTGIAAIGLLWALDGLVQAMTGWSLGGYAGADRISGLFGRHLRLGQVLASIAAYPLGVAARRAGAAGWLLMAIVFGTAILYAGSRAAWLTFALVLVFSGWRLLGWKKLLLVFAAGAIGAAALAAMFPRDLHSRIERTEAVFSGNAAGLDRALSGRLRIWDAALCMIGRHPVNGVGVRDYRDAYPACAPDLGPPAWGAGGALHAHQIVLEILSETGAIGLILWLIGAALAIRAWRFAPASARSRAAIPAVALAVTVFPLNTHLAFYSSFWGGLFLLLTALYAGALFGDGDEVASP